MEISVIICAGVSGQSEKMHISLKMKSTSQSKITKKSSKRPLHYCAFISEAKVLSRDKLSMARSFHVIVLLSVFYICNLFLLSLNLYNRLGTDNPLLFS